MDNDLLRAAQRPSLLADVGAFLGGVAIGAVIGLILFLGV